MPKFALEAARSWASRVLLAEGVGDGTARSVATALVAAEADGLEGHGLSRLPTYVAMLRSGKIAATATPVAAQPRPAALAIDAELGFAYPAIDLAIAALPEMVRQNGIAIAAIRRSSHAGALGLAVERLADAGLVALFVANTPEAIAPWGGTRAVFGTNPVAFAAPLAGRPAIVVDMALSRVARGAVVAARRKGEPIPEGWALDAAGQPTTDPDAALAGTMVAMGDAKGPALALMVEVLAAALAGAALSFEASSFLDDAGPPPATGQCLIAIDPGALAGAAFGTAMTRLAAAIEAQPGARLPGARRLARRHVAERDGIDIAESLLAAFEPAP